MASSKEESDYTSVPLDENIELQGLVRRRSSALKEWLKIGALAVVCLVVGFVAGHGWSGNRDMLPKTQTKTKDGLLDPQQFIPEIPTVPMTFLFPSLYEDTGPDGDKLWEDMMPLGAGFLHVADPRRFSMPASKPTITSPSTSSSPSNSTSNAEIYSLSITHQLHCLAVVRHVIIKYSQHDKSRFAGDGHEYHCLDYIRQAILCAGDTTLDFAEMVVEVDGSRRWGGFTGNGTVHWCRSWDAIKEFAVREREGDKTGIV